MYKCGVGGWLSEWYHNGKGVYGLCWCHNDDHGDGRRKLGLGDKELRVVVGEALRASGEEVSALDVFYVWWQCLKRTWSLGVVVPSRLRGGEV